MDLIFALHDICFTIIILLEISFSVIWYLFNFVFKIVKHISHVLIMLDICLICIFIIFPFIPVLRWHILMVTCKTYVFHLWFLTIYVVCYFFSFNEIFFFKRNTWIYIEYIMLWKKFIIQLVFDLKFYFSNC